MSITRERFAALSDFATWLQENAVPSLFKSVAFSSNTLIATGDEDNVILEINNQTFRAYRGESNYFSVPYLTAFPASNSAIDIIGCDNGFIASVGVSTQIGGGPYGFSFMATKTNNGKVAIIFPGTIEADASLQYKTNLQHVAFGDSPTMSTTTNFTPESGNQTVITPFITNADVGGKSYTPSAGYMPVHSNYGSGLNKFLLGADMYITNGYWCIKDGGAE